MKNYLKGFCTLIIEYHDNNTVRNFCSSWESVSVRHCTDGKKYEKCENLIKLDGRGGLPNI